MDYATPEACGISSSDIEAYIKVLEQNKLSTHNVILMRGDKFLFEKYWHPFDKCFLHRMYSVTKSIVAIGIGFAEQDGLLSLDDTIELHFPDELAGQIDGNMRKQTVRNMLTMTTAKIAEPWFTSKHPDRLRFYFENRRTESRPAGTIFQYDSSGTFVLCALIERLTGKRFMDYMREKLFDKLGISKDAYCLECPGGHSWGDSAILMSPSDMMLIARFLMNGGKWNGEQLLNEKFVNDAVSKQIDNNVLGIENFDTQGYGYYIWRTYDNGYFFNGMGCQLYICLPDKDLIFGYNGDNQGNIHAKNIIIDNFFNMIARKAAPSSIPENEEAKASLNKYADGLELYYVKGSTSSSIQEKINGKTFRLNNNPMGISEMTFSFKDDVLTVSYINAQGKKKLSVGMCKNAFGLFPEEGYSDLVGGQSAPGNYYRCAASAAWVNENLLFVKVQIIDKYFGILNMNFSFKDENTLGIYMNKTAEDFLDTYQGYADGRAKQ